MRSKIITFYEHYSRITYCSTLIQKSYYNFLYSTKHNQYSRYISFDSQQLLVVERPSDLHPTDPILMERSANKLPTSPVGAAYWQIHRDPMRHLATDMVLQQTYQKGIAIFFFQIRLSYAKTFILIDEHV